MGNKAQTFLEWRAEKLRDPEIRAAFDALESEYQAARDAFRPGGNVEPLSPRESSVAASAEGGTG